MLTSKAKACLQRSSLHYYIASLQHHQYQAFSKSQIEIAQTTIENTNNINAYLNREIYAQTTREMSECHSLFPEVYSSPTFFKAEFEQVFKQAWVGVGHTSSVANDGDVISTTIGNLPILITNCKGKLYAFYNVCRHRGSVLLKPGTYSKCTVIRCPYHSWGYSCNGKLMGAPYFNDGRLPSNKAQKVDNSLKNDTQVFQRINFEKENYSLFDISVRSFLGCLFVNLNADKEMADKLWDYQFGDLLNTYGHYPSEDWRIVHKMDFEIKANWKFIAENFMEYYHLPWIHPELCEISSVANHVRRQGNGQYCAFATYPLTSGNTASDSSVFPHFSGLSQIDHQSAYFIHIFPNVSLFLFPHHLMSLITSASEAEVTHESMHILFDKSIAETYAEGTDEEMVGKVNKLNDFWKMVNLQDIWAVENLQKGMQCSNVFRGGRLSAKFEETIHRFQNILIDYMTNNFMKEYPGDEHI